MSDTITKKMQKKRERRARAHQRIRSRVKGNAERPRLSVYKSLKYIYAQVIDDDRGVTLVQASSADPGFKGQLDGQGSTSGKVAAKLVGEALAARALEKGVAKVVFDRGGYVYHGNVQVLAEAAREKGLQF